MIIPMHAEPYPGSCKRVIMPSSPEILALIACLGFVFGIQYDILNGVFIAQVIAIFGLTTSVPKNRKIKIECIYFFLLVKSRGPASRPRPPHPVLLRDCLAGTGCEEGFFVPHHANSTYSKKK